MDAFAVYPYQSLSIVSSKLSIVSKGREGLDFGFFSDWSSGFCLSIRERHLFSLFNFLPTDAKKKMAGGARDSGSGYIIVSKDPSR